jgi:hypothetical protein
MAVRNPTPKGSAPTRKASASTAKAAPTRKASAPTRKGSAEGVKTATKAVSDSERHLGEMKAAYEQASHHGGTGGSSSGHPGPTRRPDRDPYYALVDAALDLGTQLIRAAGEAARQLLPEGPRRPGGGTGNATPGTAPASSGTELLSLPSTSPGKLAHGDLDIYNNSRQWIYGLHLSCQALVGAGGERIDGHHVGFQPAAPNIAPGDCGRVSVTVDVPAKAKLGRYFGLVEAAGHTGVWCLLSVDVL